MRYVITRTMDGATVQVEGAEVEAVFGGPLAGGPVDYDPAVDGTLSERLTRYCTENLLPLPAAGQVVVLGA
jgi:hypothetical protein